MLRLVLAAILVGALLAPAVASAHEASADLPLPGLAQHMLPRFPHAPPRSAAEIRAVTRKDAPGAFELVGHDPLMSRGMNAALAVHGDYAYVGNRSDAHADAVRRRAGRRRQQTRRARRSSARSDRRTRACPARARASCASCPSRAC